MYPAQAPPADEPVRNANYFGDDVFDDYFTSDDNQDDATDDDHAPDSGDDFDQDDGWGPDDAGFVPDDPAATG